MSVQQERLASQIHRHITLILDNIFKTKNTGYVTITEVRVNKDFSIATIFYTILKDEISLRNDAEQILLGYKGQIKKELASKLKNCRKFPDIVFTYDDSLNYGNKIEKILNDIKTEDK